MKDSVMSAKGLPEGHVRAYENFIELIIARDVKDGMYSGRVITRFPPEPNGYLHIGHAKSIVINFELAKKHDGKCNLRFDDTNPLKSHGDYVQSIKSDIQWLGYRWDNLCHASDYFGRMYDCAVRLIKSKDAYVCSLSPEELRDARGTTVSPGKNSPFRNRRTEENLKLFLAMKDGDISEGKAVLRANIDMSSPNINMRDPVLYRVSFAGHHRCGNDWCVYPTYDFAHCLSDSFEKVTHSVCTIEFEDHRPLYDWIIKKLRLFHPKQIEFARLQVTYALTSKRRIRELISSSAVCGWDDPRLYTVRALRRRGVPAAAIRNFCLQVGVTKKNSWSDIELLESCIREELNHAASRRMCVLRPLRVVITNFPDGKVEWVTAKNHPLRPEFGTRQIPFYRELFIEKDDFMECPPQGFRRLSLGGQVRLKYAYCITCTEVIKDENGEAVEVRCVYDGASKSGQGFHKGKVKGTVHWISSAGGACADVFLYERIITAKYPRASLDLSEAVNENSCERMSNCLVERDMLDTGHADSHFQFERIGYFFREPSADFPAGSGANPIFHRTAALRDTRAAKPVGAKKNLPIRP